MDPIPALPEGIFLDLELFMKLAQKASGSYEPWPEPPKGSRTATALLHLMDRRNQ